MTRHPEPSDPVSALAFHDGSTRAHSEDHAAVGGFQINARSYLKGDNSTEAAADVTAFTSAAAGKRVFWPPGIYRMPNGVGIAASSGTHHMGVPGQTYITAKDNYAFTVTGASDVSVEDMQIVCIAGSTVGGAVKTSGSSNNSFRLRNVYAYADDNGGTVPMFDLSGIIGALIEGCTSTTAPIGFYLHPGQDFNNTNTIFRCRAVNANNANTYATESAGSLNAGIVAETQQLAIYSTIIESCYHGYGFYGRGLSGGKLEDIWFEANQKSNCVIENANSFIVRDSKFQYMTAGDASAQHLTLSESRGSGQTNNVIIENNNFQDGTTSGTYLTIGANVEDTKLIANRALTDATIVDSGTRSNFVFNRGVKNKIADAFTGYLTLTGSTQVGDNGDLMATGLLGVSDTLGDEIFAVTRKGYSVQRTKNGDPSSGMIPTNSFALYWDEANARLAARVRNNAGTEAIFNIASATASAYTVTNPTTDRALNVTADTTAQVAQVLGTLIADLQTRGVLG